MIQQYLVSFWLIFSWLLLALQVKVGKVASFTNIYIVPHENYPLHVYIIYIYIWCVYSDFSLTLVQGTPGGDGPPGEQGVDGIQVGHTHFLSLY